MSLKQSIWPQVFHSSDINANPPIRPTVLDHLTTSGDTEHTGQRSGQAEKADPMRMLAMAGGIAGAIALSQFPEFSQQYVQRLSGAVDELRAVTIMFDGAARVGGLTREEALAQLRGTGFGDQFSDDMRSRIYRYERLNADYQALASAAPLERLAKAYHIRDPELVQRTWDDFQPAVPVTSEGLISAAIGYALGWALVSLLLGLLRRPFRRYA